MHQDKGLWVIQKCRHTYTGDGVQQVCYNIATLAISHCDTVNRLNIRVTSFLDDPLGKLGLCVTTAISSTSSPFTRRVHALPTTTGKKYHIQKSFSALVKLFSTKKANITSAEIFLMNDHSFPFGVQTCQLKFGSWVNEQYKVEYR